MYDFIGDVHGCYDEMHELLLLLGYSRSNDGVWSQRDRKPVFLGDLTDRGPASLQAVEDVAATVLSGNGKYVPGNHCDKLYRFFLGRNIQIKHGLETTVAEWEQLSSSHRSVIKDQFMQLFEQAPLYHALDEGRVYAAHAGLRRIDQGHVSKQIRTFVLYGDITEKKDETGFPVRRDWAKVYDGSAWVIYGHTPVRTTRMLNRTANIDTGCVFGGALTALSYPEMTTTAVHSRQPFQPEKFHTFSEEST
ncbi:protein phosphatase [Salsuginibacillus halophilus]|uniref:Protein phosphatase n=1 Tax=Salsuginibacillus halophilus TaxID=517424 RepID=A0A2P8HXE5_9BACI|nr:bis(5'-nucleosyl)-tetraphosphatase PrpE [Salsuginibacillus halophilus]PSL50901.1 protein phosphatase [Salsuginibacillus halophilus]